MVNEYRSGPPPSQGTVTIQPVPAQATAPTDPVLVPLPALPPGYIALPPSYPPPAALPMAPAQSLVPAPPPSLPPSASSRGTLKELPYTVEATEVSPDGLERTTTRRWYRWSSHRSEAPPPTEVRTVEVPRFHMCVECGRKRSRRYHQEHPIHPGEIPIRGVCRLCREKKAEEGQGPHTYRYIRHRVDTGSQEHIMEVEMASDDEKRGRSRERDHSWERRIWVTRSTSPDPRGRKTTNRTKVYLRDPSRRRSPSLNPPPPSKETKIVRAPLSKPPDDESRGRRHTIVRDKVRIEDYGTFEDSKKRIATHPMPFRYGYQQSRSPSPAKEPPLRSASIGERHPGSVYEGKTRFQVSRSILRQPSRSGYYEDVRESFDSTTAELGGDRVQFSGVPSRPPSRAPSRAPSMASSKAPSRAPSDPRSRRSASVTAPREDFWKERARERARSRGREEGSRRAPTHIQDTLYYRDPSPRPSHRPPSPPEYANPRSNEYTLSSHKHHAAPIRPTVRYIQPPPAPEPPSPPLPPTSVVSSSTSSPRTPSYPAHFYTPKNWDPIPERFRDEEGDTESDDSYVAVERRHVDGRWMEHGRTVYPATVGRTQVGERERSRGRERGRSRVRDV